MSACDSMSNFTAGVVRYQLAEQVTICVRHQLAEICQESAVGSQLTKSFFAPYIRAVMVASLLPEPSTVARHEFQGTKPFCALPKIRCFQLGAAGDKSHHAAQWITMIR